MINLKFAAESYFLELANNPPHFLSKMFYICMCVSLFSTYIVSGSAKFNAKDSLNLSVVMQYLFT